MVKIRKASDNAITCPSFLFAGDARGGKTTMIAKAAKFHVKRTEGKKFIVINSEPKDRTAGPEMLSCPPEVEIVDNPKWAEILEIFTMAPERWQAGIAIDGFDMYCRESFYDILKVAESPRFNIGQTFMGNQNAWHIQGHRMLNHFRILLDKQIPVIATSRLNYDKDEVSGKIFTRTNAEGKSGIEVPPMFTCIGVCLYKEGSANPYVVKFRPHNNFPAGDTGGVLEPEEPADYEYLWNKVTGVLPKSGAALSATTKPAGGK